MQLTVKFIIYEGLTYSINNQLVLKVSSNFFEKYFQKLNHKYNYTNNKTT